MFRLLPSSATHATPPPSLFCAASRRFVLYSFPASPLPHARPDDTSVSWITSATSTFPGATYTLSTLSNIVYLLSTSRREAAEAAVCRVSSVIKTTADAFRNLALPRSGFVPMNSACVFSEVPLEYKIMFSEYKVRDWKSFNEDASRVLTGRANRRLSDERVSLIKPIPAQLELRPKPTHENDLMIRFANTILDPTCFVAEPQSHQWVPAPPSTREVFKLRTPDFVLRKRPGSAGSSSTQRSDSSRIPIAAGELKKPCLKLGSSLSAASVTQLISGPDFYKLNKANPFFQVFSYLLNTQKGVGILTNFDETRFFKINQKDKELLMSPLVRVDQRLIESKNGRIPHVVQAYIYPDEMSDPTSDELSRKTTEKQLAKAIEKARELEKRLKEEEAKKKASGSDSSRKKSSGGGASSSSKSGKKGKQSSYEIFSPASRILEKCRVIGTVGEGVTGHVTECDFEGLKVAVKTGFPYDYRDARDCFFHVRNEIYIYEKLKDLQGSVVPRVLAGCLERYYTPSTMVLITEKVGMAVEEKEEKLFIGDKELNRGDLLVMKEKGLEGLEKIHACGVVHLDAVTRNIRVELRGDKVERVWWIDLGDAAAIDYEAGMVWDKGETGIDLELKQALDLDNKTYAGEIDWYLMHMESTS